MRGVSRVATRKLAALAEEALPAGDDERDDDAIPLHELRHGVSYLDDHAHILVTEDVAGFHRRLISVEQVKVRSADSSGRDLDDDVAGILNLRIGNIVDAHVARSMPTECFHNKPSFENLG